jgi:ketosteroid isomerase-like protein
MYIYLNIKVLKLKTKKTLFLKKTRTLTIVGICFAIILSFSSCISVRVTEKNATVETENLEKERQEIKYTLNSMWAAIEQNDIEKYASYIHPAFTQFGETDPILQEGKQAEIDGIKDWMKNSSNIHTEMIDPKITIKDNVAWIVYYWKDNGMTDGKPFTSTGKSTRIFVKENGKWLCIHGHYTLLS